MLRSVRSKATHPAALAIFTFVALAVVTALAVPTSTEAQLTRCGTEFIYFSDSSHTDVVGYRAYEPEECGCTLYSWGSISVHRELYDFFC